MARLTRAERIAKSARLAFGKDWQSPLARAAGVSQSLLTKLISPFDPRTVTDKVYGQIARALLARAEQMQSAAYAIKEQVGLMLAELEE